jgi:AbrB family looped-hinge helix DNA binding protein
MTKATVTSKGQVVIPAEIRKRHNIQKGTQIAFIEQGDHLLLRPITPEFLRSFMGIAKGKTSLLAIRRRAKKEDWPSR